MKLSLYILFLSFMALASAFNLFGKRAETTSTVTPTTATLSTALVTTVWPTVTINGVTTVVLSIYSQSFITTYSETTGTVPSGSIGVGSLSSVGGIRSYSQTTVNGGSRASTGVVGAVLAVLGWVL